MEYMSAREAAKKWEVSRTSVASWCKLGYVPDAIQVSSQWLIPPNLTIDDVKRPSMGRPTEKQQKTR